MHKQKLHKKEIWQRTESCSIQPNQTNLNPKFGFQNRSIKQKMRIMSCVYAIFNLNKRPKRKKEMLNENARAMHRNKYIFIAAVDLLLGFMIVFSRALEILSSRWFLQRFFFLHSYFFFSPFSFHCGLMDEKKRKLFWTKKKVDAF